MNVLDLKSLFVSLCIYLQDFAVTSLYDFDYLKIAFD